LKWGPVAMHNVPSRNAPVVYVRNRDVEHQTQHTDVVRLFIGILDTYIVYVV